MGARVAGELAAGFAVSGIAADGLSALRAGPPLPEGHRHLGDRAGPPARVRGYPLVGRRRDAEVRDQAGSSSKATALRLSDTEIFPAPVTHARSAESTLAART